MSQDGCLTRSQKTKQQEALAGSTRDRDFPPVTTTIDQDEGDAYEDAEDDKSIHDPTRRESEESAGGSTHEVIEDTTKQTLVISDKNISTFRILRKITKGATRAQYNKQKLEKLVREGRLPKGLGVRRFPLNVPNVSLALQIRWDEAHTRLSRDLTLLMIDYWDEREQNLNKDIKDLNHKLRSEASKSEVEHIEQLLKKYTQETKDELQRREEERKKKIREENGVDEPEEEEIEAEEI